MKNFFLATIIVIFFLMSFYMIEKKQSSLVMNEKNEEMKAIFISYIELEKYIKDKSSNESKSNIISILENVKNNGFNTIILHVRPFSDAIYVSNIFPISKCVKNKDKNPSYDILKYIIEEAHKKNIAIHAWINPYRISSNTNINDLNSMISSFLKSGDAKVIEEKGIYYNPASKSVNKLILSGIKELVINYEIDGIIFDDYFYPNKSIDLDNYKEYVNNGGELSIDNYRFDVILAFIKDVYWTIKSINKKTLFGISPEGNINNNYNTHYLDVKKLLSEEGYVDYIMPQIYFGFENSNRPFVKTLNEWNLLIKNGAKLIPALAFYKSGKEDFYAGSGKNEWIDNKDIISREVVESRKVNNYGGFSVFRYDSMFSPENNNKINEFIKLKELLN